MKKTDFVYDVSIRMLVLSPRGQVQATVEQTKSPSAAEAKRNGLLAKLFGR